MRLPELEDGSRVPGSHTHVCWSFTDPVEFGSRARRFLLDGLAAGQRVCFMASGDPEELVARLRGLGGFDAALRAGAATVASVNASHAAGVPVEPEAQVRVYAAETEAAIADGHTGLRAAVDATELVRTPEQLEAFLRYEHLIDRYMIGHPFSAMCAYNRRELDEFAVAQLACMHPDNNLEAVLFRLHACLPAAGDVALRGELDLASHDLFPQALERADLPSTNGRLVLAADDLAFIDHRCMLALARYANRRDTTAVLRTPLRSAMRIVEVLGVSSVRVESAV